MQSIIGAMGGQEMIEKSFVCAHVKVANIECKEVDEGIHEILKTLRTGGILCDRISIKTPAPSTYCKLPVVILHASYVCAIFLSVLTCLQ